MLELVKPEIREYLERIQFTYPHKLTPFFTSDDYLYYIGEGGRGSGKTETMGQVAIHNSFLGNEGGKLLITRYIEKSIDASTYSTIRNCISRLKLKDIFNIKKTYIENKISGCEFIFAGLSEKTMDNLTSIDDVFFAWIDEAHKIPAEAWDRFYPSIRGTYADGRNAKIFITYNPHTEDDVFYQRFILQKRSEALVIHINHDDNPWFKYRYVPKLGEDKKPMIDPASGKPILVRKKTSLYMQYLSDLKYMPKGYVRHIWEGELKQYNDDIVIDTRRIGRFDDTQQYKYDYLALSLDTAYSIKESADFSVIIIGGGIAKGDKEELHILKIMRGRWEFNDLINNLMLAHKWVEETQGRQPDSILIENKASGQSLIQEMERLTTFYIDKVKPSNDKYTRVCEVLPFIGEGKLKIPQSNNASNVWIKPFMVELEMFRADNKHEHDDQVDALTQLISDFQKNKPIAWSSVQW